MLSSECYRRPMDGGYAVLAQTSTPSSTRGPQHHAARIQDASSSSGSSRGGEWGYDGHSVGDVGRTVVALTGAVRLTASGTVDAWCGSRHSHGCSFGSHSQHASLPAPTCTMMAHTSTNARPFPPSSPMSVALPSAVLSTWASETNMQARRHVAVVVRIA